MKVPARTAVGVREDDKKSAFAAVFDDGVVDVGGGGRRHCGEREGAVTCIFGVSGRVGRGGVMKVSGK